MALFRRTPPPPPPVSRIDELKTQLLRDPGSRQFLALAEEYRKTGKLIDVVQTLERGLQFNQGYVAAYVALGKAYHQIGKLDDAIRIFLEALRFDGQNLVAIRQLGELYFQKGEKIEAIKKLKLFRGLSPGDRGVNDQIELLEIDLKAERLAKAPRVETWPSVTAAALRGGVAPARPGPGAPATGESASRTSPITAPVERLPLASPPASPVPHSAQPALPPPPSFSAAHTSIPEPRPLATGPIMPPMRMPSASSSTTGPSTGVILPPAPLPAISRPPAGPSPMPPPVAVPGPSAPTAHAAPSPAPASPAETAAAADPFEDTFGRDLRRRATAEAALPPAPSATPAPSAPPAAARRADIFELTFDSTRSRTTGEISRPLTRPVERPVTLPERPVLAAEEGPFGDAMAQSGGSPRAVVPESEPARAPTPDSGIAETPDASAAPRLEPSAAAMAPAVEEDPLKPIETRTAEAEAISQEAPRPLTDSAWVPVREAVERSPEPRAVPAAPAVSDAAVAAVADVAAEEVEPAEELSPFGDEPPTVPIPPPLELPPPPPDVLSPAAALAAEIPVVDAPITETPVVETPVVATDAEIHTAPVPSTEVPAVTETLAELYRTQGHPRDAAAAYEQLADRAPDPDAARHFIDRAAEVRSRADAAGAPLGRLRRLADRLPVPPETRIEDLGSALNRLLSRVPGIQAAAVTDLEGLPVVVAGHADEAEMEALIAELTAFWKSVLRRREDIGTGTLGALTVQAGKGVALVSAVSPEYSLILRTGRDVPIGQVRYEAERAAALLRPALG